MHSHEGLLYLLTTAVPYFETKVINLETDKYMQFIIKGGKHVQ